MRKKWSDNPPCHAKGTNTHHRWNNPKCDSNDDVFLCSENEVISSRGVIKCRGRRHPKVNNIVHQPSDSFHNKNWSQKLQTIGRSVPINEYIHNIRVDQEQYRLLLFFIRAGENSTQSIKLAVGKSVVLSYYISYICYFYQLSNNKVNKKSAFSHLQRIIRCQTVVKDIELFFFSFPTCSLLLV